MINQENRYKKEFIAFLLSCYIGLLYRSVFVGQIPPHFGAVDYINTDRDVYLFAVSNSGRGMSYVQEIPQVLLSILFEKEEETSLS